MAAAQRCNRANHGVADRPLHHDCRGYRQMGLANPPIRKRFREMSHDPTICWTRKVASIALLAVMLTSCGWAWAESSGKPTTPVRVWEDSMTIPTSEEGLPDPNPPFD